MPAEAEKKKRPWVQAAVDVEDIGTGRQIARMAAEAGAEWIEVGTPLLVRCGTDAIRQLREAAGPDVRLIADYKYFHGPTLIPPAAEAGADLVLMEDIWQDRFVEESLTLAKEYGVGLVYSLIAKKPSDYVERALQLVSLGVDALFMWRKVSFGGKVYETLKDVRAVTDVSIGVSDDDLESAAAAVREGADWITFGTALKQNDPVITRQWIDTIHGAI